MRAILDFLQVVLPLLTVAALVVIHYAPFVLSGRISRDEEAAELRRLLEGDGK